MFLNCHSRFAGAHTLDNVKCEHCANFIPLSQSVLRGERSWLSSGFLFASSLTVLLCGLLMQVKYRAYNSLPSPPTRPKTQSFHFLVKSSVPLAVLESKFNCDCLPGWGHRWPYRQHCLQGTSDLFPMRQCPFNLLAIKMIAVT